MISPYTVQRKQKSKQELKKLDQNPPHNIKITEFPPKYVELELLIFLLPWAAAIALYHLNEDPPDNPCQRRLITPASDVFSLLLAWLPRLLHTRTSRDVVAKTGAGSWRPPTWPIISDVVLGSRGEWRLWSESVVSYPPAEIGPAFFCYQGTREEWRLHIRSRRVPPSWFLVWLLALTL